MMTVQRLFAWRLRRTTVGGISGFAGAFLLVAAIGGCDKSSPAEGYRRSGPEAIAQAKRFQERAEACFKGNFGGRACAEAAKLYEVERNLPASFATDAEWDEFADAYFGGIHLLMRASLQEMCSEPIHSAASPTAKSICAGHEAGIAQRIERQKSRRLNCPMFTDHWPKSVGPFLPDGEPPFAQVRLRADDTFEWNASELGFEGGWRRVDRNELRQLLQALDKEPEGRSLIVVDVLSGAKCREIAALSGELNGLSMCKERRCLERRAWENYSDR
mgnify:CR=1 FL=1